MNAFTRLPTTFVPLTPKLRARLEATIEDLVAILDTFDGNPDEEEDDFAEDDEREPEETDQDGDEQEPDHLDAPVPDDEIDF